jgi:hypothetical protein
MCEYVRIHREHAKSVMSLLSLKSIVCADGVKIPVSKLYKDKFQEYINRNFMV